MNSVPEISYNDRVLGALWGSVVGDALGVPVEFRNRVEVQSDPVTGMRGYGTHRQPKGTWSDDSSLLLCSAESLLRHEFDTSDMGKRFLAWYREEIWTPHGRVFDIGVATANALSRIATGVRAEVAGGDGQFSNGNGSLMRIIPVSLRFAKLPTRQFLDRVHRASSITHRHARSQMACGFFSLMIRELLAGFDRNTAFVRALREFRDFYELDPFWCLELDYFQLLLAGDLPARREAEIDSSGYVIHTLTASLWCLLTSSNFQQCALKAVNLGGDTDTTGCVAGGLAGAAWGIQSIPSEWISELARHDDLRLLFHDFARLCSETGAA
jgi:ADP-ribosylglycohydrolase